MSSTNEDQTLAIDRRQWFHTVKIDDDFESVIPCPGDGFREVGQLSLNEGFSTRDVEGPVADGQSNMVETEQVDGALGRWV